MPTLTFLSLFLGLVSGWQVIDLHATPEIRSVRLVLDGEVIRTFSTPPFRGNVNLGSGLSPRELVAIGLDASGVEVARATQMLNVPRRQGEVELLFDGAALKLKTSHRLHAPLEQVVVRIDGRKIASGRDLKRVDLPKLDSAMPHVISVDATFSDGFVARREAVIDASAGYSDASVAELTPIAFADRARRQKLDGCFFGPRGAARVSGVDDKEPVVFFVKDPNATDAQERIRKMVEGRGRIQLERTRRNLKLLHGVDPKVFWPIASVHTADGEPVVQAFDSQTYNDGIARDLYWLAGRSRSEYPETKATPRRYADAVATAGIAASAEGKRRAVVLLLAGGEDSSSYVPSEVRQFLRAIGVPLFVWSLDPSAPIVTHWADVEDISTLEGFVAAVKKLNDSIAVQRIAWVAASPVEALKLQAAKECTLEPLAAW